MSYRYPIKKGAENRIFAEARNLGNGIVESDEPLESIYLEPAIEEQAAPATTTPPVTPPTETSPPAPPVQPAAPQTPPATQNKEANS